MLVSDKYRKYSVATNIDYFYCFCFADAFGTKISIFIFRVANISMQYLIPAGFEIYISIHSKKYIYFHI